MKPTLTLILLVLMVGGCGDSTRDRISFDQQENLHEVLREMEGFLLRFPNTGMVNYFIDNSGFLYLNNEKVGPLKGSLNNPKIRGDLVFKGFTDKEIDSFFEALFILKENGINDAHHEAMIDKIIFSYKSENVKSANAGRHLFVINDQHDTSNSNFNKYFEILDVEEDIVLFKLKERH